MTTPSSLPASDRQASRNPTPARLSTGVVIILLITMFTSCSAASSARDAANNAANQQASSDTAGLATSQDVQAMCRLLGAVAAKQGTDVTALFKNNPTGSVCEQAATESGVPHP
ncbi:hypothetical protein GCM10009721_36360 [Terrabacter tumescens]|uniref:Uncharacterized protein n=1 Tax=Terrabacter tumescens TaxID=60443 RepID=A0ABQ2IF12_9MICO|nr:hypothetical protein [Terrabacter tumescens]GGN05540.1 hypothetical protein GCM10009721_36360 [Terrabacter tumescens]